MKRWTIRIGVILGCCATTAGAQATPEQVVLTQVAAFNHHDVAAMLSVEAQTASIVEFGDTAGIHTIRTADTARMEWTDWFSRDPKINAQVIHHFVAGAFVADYLHLTGATDGKPRDLVVIWQVKEGRVVNVWQTPALVLESGQPRASTEPLHGVLKRVSDAIDRRDWDAAVVVIADTMTYHDLGGYVVRRITPTGMRDGLAQMGQRMKHQVIEEMIVPPFVVQHERISGKPDGTVGDAVDVFQVRDGHIVAEWESAW